MKKNVSFLLFILLCMVRIESFAHDIAVKNADGVTIYYDWSNNNTELTVVYRDYADDKYDGPGFPSYSGNVVIPELVNYNGKAYSVTSIGDQAFYGSIDLTSVTIPNSVTFIGKKAFSHCNGLTLITLEDGNSVYDSRNNCNAIIETASNTLIVGCNNTNIPNSVTSIGDYAFSGRNMVSVAIPDNVISIGEGAFLLSKLAYVTFGNGVTSIGGFAFEYCSSLTSVTIPDNVTSIGEWAFANCSNLANITFGNGVTSIGRYAFAYCKSLVSVTTPNNMTSIGEYAFSLCGMVSVTITDNVTSIGEYAFSNCSNLTSVTFGYGVDSISVSAFGNNKALTDMYFYGKVLVSSFDYLAPNITLHVQDTIIESIKNDDAYKNFKDIVVLAKVTDFNLTYYVDGIEYVTEQYKYDDIIVPVPWPTKKGMTFMGWSSIPETMPGKDVIVTGTFDWSKLTKNGVVYQVTDTLKNYSSVIGNDNASGMITITSDIVFDYTYKVTSIADKAFNGCKGITSIDMPATITSIGERAFAGVDKLTDVTIYAENVPETDRTAFENSYTDYVTLHVPYGSVDKYKAVGPWKDFKEIVAIEGTEPVSVETCVIPTISFVDGKLEFESETDGAECYYEIKVEDAKEGVGAEVELTSAYEISVYAHKEGYNDSEKNTATLYWVYVDPISTGVIDKEIRVNANAILVQNTGGSISISGVGADVMIYNISGQLIGQGKATGNQVVIDTNLFSGDICIIKIGDKSVKYILR